MWPVAVLLVFSAAVVATVGLAGCDTRLARDGTAAAGAGAIVRDSGGVEIVENHAPERSRGEFWTLGPEPAFVLGAGEVRSGADLGGDRDDLDGSIWRVRGLAKLVDGRIAVLSGGHHQVMIYEPSGKLSRTIGGRGQGPGEFVSPEGMQYRPPDTLVVWDYWMGPVTYFDTVGTVLERRQIDYGKMFAVVPGVSQESPKTPLPDGSFVVRVRRTDPDFVRPRDGSLMRYPLVEYLRVDLETYAPRSLGIWDGPEMWAVPGDVRASSPALASTPDWYPADLGLDSHVATGGRPPAIYVTNADRNEIRQFSLDGTLRRIIRRTIPPVRVTDKADRAQRDHFLRWMGAEAGVYAPFVEAWPKREYYPTAAALVVDSEGYLWVREWSASESGLPDQWSVFNPEGRWIGVLDALPAPSWRCVGESGFPCWIDQDWLLTLTEDDLGRERIEGYRIHRDGRER